MSAQLIKDAFGKKSLYEVLSVPRSASPAEVKKAYFRLSLELHPDRNRAADATRKFQALAVTYQILSDPERRAAYDADGAIEDDDSLDSASAKHW